MLKLFLKFELGKGKKYFRTNKSAKAITGYLFFAVFLFIGLGIYKFFFSAFNYLNANVEESIRLALTFYFYEVFLLFLAGVIIFSCVVSSIFKLFRGQNDNWVLSSPSFGQFPFMVLVRSSLISMWPLFVVFLPAMLAFNKVYGLGAVSLIFILLSFLLLLIALNALTIMALILASFVYRKITRRFELVEFSFKGFIAIVLLLSVSIVSFVWSVVKSIDLVGLFGANAVDARSIILLTENHFRFFPTHYLSLEIINWQGEKATGAIADFWLITIITLISIFALHGISHLFYPSWQRFQEGSIWAGKEARVYLSRAAVKFTGGEMAVLFKKEALVFSRNMKGVLWFLFLFAIWFSQIGTSIFLSGMLKNNKFKAGEALGIIQALQFIIAAYFIASFVLRFVFPSFSMEKKTAWILGSAPLSFRRIYFGKHLFFAVFFVFLGALMSFINARILGLAMAHAAISVLLFVNVVIFIVTMGLSLGAIFPNFETDDPEIISTSMPGLFFTAFSLIYGALGAWMLYVTLSGRSLLPLLSFIAVTFVLAIVILQKTPELAEKKKII